MEPAVPVGVVEQVEGSEGLSMGLGVRVDTSEVDPLSLVPGRRVGVGDAGELEIVHSAGEGLEIVDEETGRIQTVHFADNAVNRFGVAIAHEFDNMGSKFFSLMTRIGALLAQSPADVDILMGDFNEWFPWGRSLRRLKRHFAPAAAPATFPSRRPFLALDRIWVRPARNLRTSMVFTQAPARMASDHLTLLAELSMA